MLADEDDKRRRQIEKKLAAEPWEDVACFAATRCQLRKSERQALRS